MLPTQAVARLSPEHRCWARPESKARERVLRRLPWVARWQLSLKAAGSLAPLLHLREVLSLQEALPDLPHRAGRSLVCLATLAMHLAAGSKGRRWR
jgi:hypothetical protein